MSRYCATLVLLFLCAAVLQADVYLEIVGDGESPDGQENHFVLNYQGYFDVYVWGSGSDTSLNLAKFDIHDVEAVDCRFDTLGTIDPGGLFAGTNSAGSITPDQKAIEGVTVFDVNGVNLPQQMGSALLIYDNMDMYFTGALIRAFPSDVVTNASTSPTVHSIGVWSTPEPGSLLLLALGGMALGRGRGRTD